MQRTIAIVSKITVLRYLFSVPGWYHKLMKTVASGYSLFVFRPCASSFFVFSTNHEARKAVNVPNNPTPTAINSAAMILPSVVTGYLSPYPTLVMVTYDHQMASSAVFMLLFGSCSTSSIEIEENMMVSMAMIAAVANVPLVLLLNTCCMRCLVERKALRILSIRSSLIARPARMYSRLGILATRSIQPHFINRSLFFAR